MFYYQAPIQWVFHPHSCYLIPSIPDHQMYFYGNVQIDDGNLESFANHNPPINPQQQFQMQNSPQEMNQLIASEQPIASNPPRSDGNLTKKNCKALKRKRVGKEEEEFTPYKSTNKKKKKYPQNANRNIVPNIIHHVISFIQNKNKSQTLVGELIKRLKLSDVCSTQKFYLYQRLIRGKLNSYLNIDSLKVFRDIQETSCEVYSAFEQKSYNKISCMLAEYFLRERFDSIILTSCKVNSEKRLEHLKVKRIVLSRIREVSN